MVKSQGVEAYLVRYGDKHRYPEHAPPPAEGGVLDLSTMAYVEIVTGERYEVVVAFTADFDFKGFPDFKLVWDVDNHRRRVIYSSERVQKSIRSKGQYTHRFNSRPALVDGKWMGCGLSFADLQLDEDAEPTADQVLNDIDRIGQVKIIVECGVESAELDRGRRDHYTDFAVTATSSKDVVKKNHVSHSTSYTAIHEQPAKKPDKYLFEPASIPGYQPVALTLRFRSRTSLQLLKIIPHDDDNYSADTTHHSTEPAADSSDTTIHPAKVSTVEKKRTAEMAGLEASPQDKSTLRLSSQSDNTSQQPQAVVIKKEQNDNIKVEPADDNLSKAAQHATHEQSTRGKATADRRLSTPNSQHSSTRVPTSSQSSSLQPHQPKEAIVIKGESDDDLEIIEARSTPRAQRTPHSSAQPASVSATQTIARKRASAKLRLEMLEVKKRKLEVEREELELRQEMLELE